MAHSSHSKREADRRRARRWGEVVRQVVDPFEVSAEALEELMAKVPCQAVRDAIDAPSMFERYASDVNLPPFPPPPDQLPSDPDSGGY